MPAPVGPQIPIDSPGATSKVFAGTWHAGVGDDSGSPVAVKKVSKHGSEVPVGAQVDENVLAAYAEADARRLLYEAELMKRYSHSKMRAPRVGRRDTTRSSSRSVVTDGGTTRPPPPLSLLRGTYEDRDSFYLVMDRIGDITLDRWWPVFLECSRRGLSRIAVVDAVRLLMHDILWHLTRCHKLAIAHNDVKLANFVVSKEGDDILNDGGSMVEVPRLSLIDFGLAARISSGARPQPAREAGAIAAAARGSTSPMGVVHGTPHYLAPEIINAAHGNSSGGAPTCCFNCCVPPAVDADVSEDNSAIEASIVSFDARSLLFATAQNDAYSSGSAFPDVISLRAVDEERPTNVDDEASLTNSLRQQETEGPFADIGRSDGPPCLAGPAAPPPPPRRSRLPPQSGDALSAFKHAMRRDKSEHIAAKADAWAAGVILYYLVYSRLPFSPNVSDGRPPELSVLTGILFENKALRGGGNLGDCAELQNVHNLLRGLLCKDPKSRWSCASALRSPFLRR